MNIRGSLLTGKCDVCGKQTGNGFNHQKCSVIKKQRGQSLENKYSKKRYNSKDINYLARIAV